MHSPLWGTVIGAFAVQFIGTGIAVYVLFWIGRFFARRFQAIEGIMLWVKGNAKKTCLIIPVGVIAFVYVT